MNRKKLKKIENDLVAHGTSAGPVTREMVRRCKDKVRFANRYLALEPFHKIKYWPDFLAVVRQEMKDEVK